MFKRSLVLVVLVSSPAPSRADVIADYYRARSEQKHNFNQHWGDKGAQSRCLEHDGKDACRMAGSWFFSALTPNWAEASKYFRHGCELGEPNCCTMLASMYTEGGHGLVADLKAAVGWLRRACALDFAEGCTVLGKAFRAGDGVERASPADAYYYFRKACDLGDKKACGLYDEAKFKCNGEQCAVLAESFVKTNKNDDLVVGAILAVKGCAEGSARCCGLLGQMLERGTSVVKDDAEAQRLYGQACRGGARKFCEKSRVPKRRP